MCFWGFLKLEGDGVDTCDLSMLGLFFFSAACPCEIKKGRGYKKQTDVMRGFGELEEFSSFSVFSSYSS